MKTILPFRPILLLLGLAATAIAQNPTAPVPPAPEAQTAPEAQPQPVEEPVKNESEILADKLLELKFVRSPDAIFQALQNRDTQGELEPAEAFRQAVMFGDWQAVGETLASLPADKATKVYEKLLEEISKQAVSVGTVLREPTPPSEDEDPYESRRRIVIERQKSDQQPAPLLSEDFYGLIEAAPGNLTESQIPAIAKLVEVALGEGGRESLNARLKEGWKGLGGDTPEGAMLATRLLSALRWIRDAGPFLPLEESEWEKVDLEQLIFTLEYFTTVGIEDRDERQLARAAAVCARLMKASRIGNYTRPQFRLAMARLVALLPALEPEAARTLIREQLFGQRATLSDLIAIFGEEGRKAARADDLPARVASLGTQRLILDALVTMQEPLPPNASLLVLNWLAEAEGCYRAGGVVASEMTQAQKMMLRRYGMYDQAKVTTLSTEQVLDSAPPAEIVARLNPGLAQRVKLTLLKVKVLAAGAIDLTEVRAYAAAHPGLERQICQDVLAAWVSKQTKPAESEQVKRMRAYGMYVPPQMTQNSRSIPLTRLRQNQNIEELKNLLGELRGISPEPLDPALIVEAFMTLHSGAEVYQIDDIVAIFGPPESMVRAELLNLLEGMRARLGEEWRDPATQQQAGTNRTEKEVKDEVSRGYRTALELAKRGIPDDDSDWRSLITRGRLFYDASQYEFDRQIQLSEYVGLRDDAFTSFRRAAETYASGIGEMPKGQWTIEPYQAWFFVMLGASDLAQLTSNTARTDPGLQAIGDAMRALPGESSDRHLTMFGEMLGTIFPRVPANVRQRFLSSGLKIIGEDHPAAASATRSLDYYRELLDEIQLRVTVDGSTEVGHGRPFGLFIGLESTRQLLRESGGFGKYLRGASQGMGGPPGRDLRGDFERNIHAALDETFEIVSISFHDGSVKPIPLAREGWMDTPLAYLVLRAKNAAVDRIPSIQIDMDFIDQPGEVVLPVLSQVQPLDARAESVPPRPCPELTFDITLDEREWPDGRLAVEISASGQGVISDLTDFFDYQREGFEAEVVDGTQAITEFTSDGVTRSPRADRNWQITYRRQAGAAAPQRFQLPVPIGPATTAKLDFKLYRDADLIKLSPEEAAKGIVLSATGSAGAKPWIIAGIALLAMIAVLWFALRSRKPRAAVDKGFTAPAEPTPFSTVAFLRRVRSECQLPEKDLQTITAQIREIESSCFGPAEKPSPDLRGIVKQWLGAARAASR